METFKSVPTVAFHPGKTLTEKLKEMDMSVREFALRTSKSEKTIFAIINGSSSITSDMAIAFEIVTRMPAQFWLNKQRDYDEYVARTRREAIIKEAHDWASRFPFDKMAELGWVEPCDNLGDKVQALFNYFQFSTVKAWYGCYYKKRLKVAFSISLNSVKEPYAIAAWLRQGELQAETITVDKFTYNNLKLAINEMKALMDSGTADFVSGIQPICARLGVKLIFTPCLPMAPIKGATRWINGAPCIQMADIHYEHDTFWLAFFHGVGHILLHGKKDLFLEGIDYDSEKTKEKEAEDFAAGIIAPTELA